MQDTKKILAIIPARGGSKGIPKKNIRLLNYKPLISYIIRTAQSSQLLTDFVVSTEDDEIAEYAKRFGAKIIKRPEALSGDKISLDPVIFDAMIQQEKKSRHRFDLIVTLQPTTPLLSPQTLDRAIKTFLVAKNKNTLMSVVEHRHLYWMQKKGKEPMPLYDKRVNRQQLDPIFQEAGAIVISRRQFVTKNNRVSPPVRLFQLPETESLDIDSAEDWALAETRLQRKNIIIRVEGSRSIGLGHVYRGINLASHIMHHNVLFVTSRKNKLGVRKIKENNFPLKEFNSETELIKIIKNFNTHIFINDCLDTDEKYIQHLKKTGVFIVTLEDLGDGSKQADIVINALYEYSSPPHNHFYGYTYESVRDEFTLFQTPSIKKKPQKIVLSFGGTDVKGLTLSVLKALPLKEFKKYSLCIILGLGCSNTYTNKVIAQSKAMSQKGLKIEVHKNVKFMAEHLSDADVVLTSNGRTIFEIASLGIPMISISQNERELSHLFSRISKGVVNTGLAQPTLIKKIPNILLNLLADYKKRKAMSDDLNSHDWKHGTDRVINLILNSYNKKNHVHTTHWG